MFRDSFFKSLQRKGQNGHLFGHCTLYHIYHNRHAINIHEIAPIVPITYIFNYKQVYKI